MIFQKRKQPGLENINSNSFIFLTAMLFIVSCNSNTNLNGGITTPTNAHACMDVPQRFAPANNDNMIISNDTSYEGMILIPSGGFEMGGDNEQAGEDEYPKHKVSVSAFYMDATEVTNAQFQKFVAATGYITTAERNPDWEELKKILPPGTPKPHDSILVASSLIFHQTSAPVNLKDYSQWWRWVSGANWKHPEGPGSTISGRENYPVVHVSWDDAMAYCRWANKRLPTEAEWEYAARGGLDNQIYFWGNEHVNIGDAKCNSWEGKFPYLNIKKDGFIKSGPVGSYTANGYGLFDMAGNVWEWCSDWYDYNYYKSFQNQEAINPQGPPRSFDPDDPYTQKRSLRGGSFLCNDGYCSGYRVARRMKSSPDTGLEHTGFRCVKDVN